MPTVDRQSTTSVAQQWAEGQGAVALCAPPHPDAISLRSWLGFEALLANRPPVHHVGWPSDRAEGQGAVALCAPPHPDAISLRSWLGFEALLANRPPVHHFGWPSDRAEGQGFEPWVRGYLTTVFKTVSLGHSDSPPVGFDPSHAARILD